MKFKPATAFEELRDINSELNYSNCDSDLEEDIPAEYKYRPHTNTLSDLAERSSGLPKNCYRFSNRRDGTASSDRKENKIYIHGVKPDPLQLENCSENRAGKIYQENNSTCDKRDVSCCSMCREEQHWPIDCSELKQYHRRMVRDGFHRLIDIKEFKVEAIKESRTCPHCNHRVYQSDRECDVPVNGQYIWLPRKYQSMTILCPKCQQRSCWKCEHLETTMWRCGDNHTALRRKPCDRLCLKSAAAIKKPTPRPVETGNKYFDEACTHRLYKAHFMKQKLSGSKKRLLAAVTFKSAEAYLSMTRGLPLTQYLRQVERLIISTHKLLEYCYAAHIANRRQTSLVNHISLLTYQVNMLEQALASQYCNSKTLERMSNFHQLVERSTNILVSKFSVAVIGEQSCRYLGQHELRRVEHNS